MSDASPVETVTTPVRPRPTRRPVRRAPSTSSAVSSSSSRSRQRMTPAASRAASVTRVSPASEPGVGHRGRLRLVAPADLDRHDRLAELERAVGQGEEPFRALEPLDEQDDRGRLGVVEAEREVVADVEDDLRAAADDPREADPVARMDERVGHRARLGDPGDAAARQVGRDVADVGRAVGDEVDDAHAVRPEERQAVFPRDPRDLGLHRGGRLAALDDAAARDDDRRDAGRGGGLGHGRGTQRVERHDRDVRPLRERVEARVAGLAVQLLVLRVDEVAARLAVHDTQVVADRLGDPRRAARPRRRRCSRGANSGRRSMTPVIGPAARCARGRRCSPSNLG